MAAEFQSQHHQWVTGPLAAVNPDKVDADVGNYIRSLYKLEKSFQDSPKALQIATSVKAEVEAFKEHIPLVQVPYKDMVIFIWVTFLTVCLYLNVKCVK